MTDQELTETLHARGRRVTPQRVLIHRTIGELGRHATADEVLERVTTELPNASLPTVYATLELFRELGILRKVAAGDGPAVWDAGSDGHQHMVCRACGAVEDLKADLDTERLIGAARRRGFRADAAELVVSGLCARCAG